MKEITENRYKSIFDHPYLAMYRRLHNEFGLKVQLNLFYRMENFDLSLMSDAYYEEWKENSDWLKLSFHSDHENIKPYENSGYAEVCEDCKRVHEQIVRFASPMALASTTTIHFCLLTEGGLKAMEDNGVVGLLGLFGTAQTPRTSYGIEESKAEILRSGNILNIGKMSFAGIDIVLNLFSKEEIAQKLAEISDRDCIKVMIHEQYFYEDYRLYQPEFEDKLHSTFSYLCGNGCQSSFFESLIP